MAVLLAHWDNKAENQRLVCPPGAEGPEGTCSKPLAIMQDLGATFGPVKVDLNNWRQDQRVGRQQELPRLDEEPAVRRGDVS